MLYLKHLPQFVLLQSGFIISTTPLHSLPFPASSLRRCVSIVR